ncbi:hypothetical protein LguiA_025964 [Lonicera macranthoides]
MSEIDFFVFGVLTLYANTSFIVDTFLASYRVHNPRSAIYELAQTTLRTEVGKVTLDEFFHDRDTLAEKIKIFESLRAKSFSPGRKNVWQHVSM